MIRDASKLFRSSAGTLVDVPPATPINLVDTVIITSGFPLWSTGATLRDRIELPIQGSKPIAIVGYSIKANLLISLETGQGLFGKLGKLYAGLSKDPQTQRVGSPWLQYLDELPADMTLISTLWDPDVNRLPPQQKTQNFSGSTSSVFPVVTTENLAAPLTVEAGALLTAGLWLTPSLTGAVLAAWSAAYTIYYDDGS